MKVKFIIIDGPYVLTPYNSITNTNPNTRANITINVYT